MVDFEIKNVGMEACYFDFNNLPGEMLFKYNGFEILKNCGVELGILKEKSGFEEKCRLHQNDKNDWFWLETETRHPFGPEPLIRHKYEQAGNHIRVTTDIQISRQLQMENILIDNLSIPGKWKEIHIFDYEKTSGEIYKKEHLVKDITEINLEHVPLVVLFIAEDGTRLEIGAGFDLWRWSINDLFDADACFIISKETQGTLTFTRKVATWKNKFTIPKKDLDRKSVV